jgi:hypothetical protein
MKIDIDRLRALFQGYAASRRPADRRGCPSPREIARSFEPSLSRRRQRAIVDHISECPGCQEEFRIFLAQKRTEDASPDSVGPDIAGSHRRSSGRSRRWSRPVWQGASVLAGIGLSLVATLVIVRNMKEADVVRAGAPSLVLRSPKAGQTLSRPIVFRWDRHPDIESYVLELFDERMLPVWTSEAIQRHTLAVPSEVASSFRTGTYYWMVTGFTAESRRIESGLSRFTLRQ